MRHILPVALAMVAACLVCGCSQGESLADQAVKDKILLLSTATEPQTLDPHLATGVSEHHILMSLMEGLVVESPSKDDEMLPGVAERWEASERKDVWTFHLRADAKWSNGDPLTAGDFVYAFERILAPATASEYAGMLSVMKGADDFNTGKAQVFAGTVGARAIDDRTLEITLVGPTPHFLGLLPHYAWFPVHRATIEKHGKGVANPRFSLWTRPANWVGNGAFTLKEWRFKHYIEVGRNPHYWNKANVKLNGIRFLPIDNASTEERMFRDGRLHITNTLPLDKIPYYRKERPDITYSEPNLAVYFYRVNTTKPALRDARVRRALALAVDRVDLVENVTRAGQIPAKGLVPPVGAYSGPDVLRFNPEQARSLMTEAGYPGGKGFPRIDILINVSEAHAKIAEALQEQWKKHLGIDVGINNQDWGVYLNSQRNLNYDVSRAGWNADYADPMTFIDMWTTGNGNNQTGWSNVEFDKLVAATRTAATSEERLAVALKAEEIFLQELPAIPLYWYTRTYLIHPAVRGWHSKILDNHPYEFMDLVAPAP